MHKRLGGSLALRAWFFWMARRPLSGASLTGTMIEPLRMQDADDSRSECKRPFHVLSVRSEEHQAVSPWQGNCLFASRNRVLKKLLSLSVVTHAFATMHDVPRRKRHVPTTCFSRFRLTFQNQTRVHSRGFLASMAFLTPQCSRAGSLRSSHMLQKSPTAATMRCRLLSLAGLLHACVWAVCPLYSAAPRERLEGPIRPHPLWTVQLYS